MPASVSAVACAELQSSYTFVFAPDLHVAPLSEAGGDIKAIWPTYSDLPQGVSAFYMHTQYTCMTTELTESVQDTERHTVLISLTSYRRKDPSSPPAQWHLCASQP